MGIDVSPETTTLCRAEFDGGETNTFYVTSEMPAIAPRDLALSLDVIYHLIEDDAYYAYMRQLFNAPSRYVIICSSNKDAPGPAAHVRHHAFRHWISKHRPSWALIETIRTKYPYSDPEPDTTSFAGFYIFERQ
jgi:hypothetical protein